MPINDSQLDFDHHLDFFRNLGALTGDRKSDAYCYREAEYMHALCVSDAIRDLYIDSTAFAQSIASPEANFQLRFGIARRSKFIWLSFRGILALVLPNRSEPLARDQVEEIARDLNVIYINIRGTLDNLAWLLIDLFAEERTRELPSIKIGLFSNDLLNDGGLKDFLKFTEPFQIWNKELSTRRDPSAHRIPLSVVPAIIDAETKPEYERAVHDYNEAISDAFDNSGDWEVAEPKFEKAHALHERIETIGKFIPLFVHHPDRGAMKIYPTVPQDIGQLIRIARGIFGLVRTKLSSDARHDQPSGDLERD
jgi:hypothetical protein